MDITALKELPETFGEIYEEIQDSEEFDDDLRAELLGALEEAEQYIDWILKTIKEN